MKRKKIVNNKSWLQNYIEKCKHEKLKKTLKDVGVCDE